MSGDLKAWGTARHSNDPMRDSLVARAKKRRTERVTRNGWLVHGNASLGDSLDSYLVHRNGDGTYKCECWGSDHGDIRAIKGCSHVTGVMLWLEKYGDLWEDEEEDDPAEEEGGAESEEKAPDQPKPDPEPFWKITEGEEVEVRTTSPSKFDRFSLDPFHPPLPSEVSGTYDPPLLSEKFPAFRDPQWEAICEAVELFRQGYKVVFIDAPTGAGKTLLAESVRRILDVKGIYTCTTKSLQDQTMRDFGYFARLLKGRANYTTLDRPDEYPNVSAGDCMKRKARLPACKGCPGFDSTNTWDTLLDHDEEVGQYHCNFCHPVHLCPYESAKMEAKRAPLAVLNTAYLLTETNYARGLFSNWPVVIMDEADMLEELLFSFVEFEISAAARKAIGVSTLPKKTVPEDWVRWLRDEVLPATLDHMRRLKGGQGAFDFSDVGVSKKQKEYDRYKQMAGRITELTTAREVTDDEGEVTIRTELEEGWVLTGWKTKGNYQTSDPSKSPVVFKPIKVDRFGQEILWNKGQRFLLMSASWVSVEQEAENLGLVDGEWAHVEMPSSFPAENRPIVVETVAEMSNKNKATAYPIMEKEVARLIDKYPDDRILVHTVSYELTKRLYEYARRNVKDGTRVFQYTNAREREWALGKYLAHPTGVIFAPSFDRGIDLHQDDCRVQIIAKVPFPNLGDEQISARANGTGRGGKIWYAVKTIRTIIQMTGRGMRSKDDSVVTYILDRNFVRLYQQNRRLFPSWWSDALVWDTNQPKWRWLK